MCPVRSVTYVSGRSKAVSQITSWVPVRSQSAFANAPKTACCTSLTTRSLAAGSSFSVRFQSALVLGVAEYRNEHFSCRGHPILADGMAVELKRELNIAVAKQGLHSFWIGSHADQKRCQTVAKVVEAEPRHSVLTPVLPPDG